MTKKRALAVGAHPDDIEFMMAGTLLLLGAAGYELHYMTVANGSCGSVSTGAAETIAIRSRESRDAAAALDATYHEPIVDDLQVYYTPELVARLCAVMRQVQAEILLVPSPEDYMEDHSNTSRLMVTAAFCRNMPNFATDPPVDAIQKDMAIYHAMPVGLTDQLRNPVRPDIYVDTSSVSDVKRRALGCHRSQKEWLDRSQGMDGYLRTMEDLAAEVGRMSGRFTAAEGWRRHSHHGFAEEDFDPLAAALAHVVSSEDEKGRDT